MATVNPKKPSKGPTTSEKSPPVQVKVNFKVPPGMALTWIDHAVTSASDTEVVVSLYQFEYPIVRPKDGDTMATVCMARLVLTPERARQMAESILSSLKGRGVGV